MRLLTSHAELETEFTRLIRSYNEFHWTVAWAGVNSKPFQQLVLAEKKIRRIVIGIHFYQTHPDFILAFITHKGVRFIQQPDGCFHPKLYLFYDAPNNWEMLVGSGNFTQHAFTMNTEATVLISSRDDNASQILERARSAVDSAWTQAAHFTQNELNDYRKTWQSQKPKLNSLSGQYGSKQSHQKPIYTVPVATMTWQQFVSKVRNDKFNSMSERLEVVETARGWFQKYGRFGDMANDERKFVAGLPNKIDRFETPKLRSSWFGRMAASGAFHRQIQQNNVHISNALDQIPFAGQLTKAHFEGFVEHYQKAFKGNFIATATRLLAMKRPETFVCLDGPNRKNLCKDFGVPQTGMDYARYWDGIVLRIMDSDWWSAPKPTGDEEQRLSEARAAFLDCLYYEDEDSSPD